MDKKKKKYPIPYRTDGVRYLKTVKDAHRMYKRERRKLGLSSVDNKIYSGIVSSFFIAISKKIYDGHTFTFPYKIGSIYLKSYTNYFYKSRYRKGEPRRAYTNGHTYGKAFAFKWDTKQCRNFTNRKFYKFKPRQWSKALRKLGVGTAGLCDRLFEQSKDPSKAIPRR